MAPVAQKMKMFDARTGRGASPSLRRRRRAFNATAAFRAFTKGDLARARAYVAFALNNGARLADLGRAGRQVAQSEEQRDAWLALLRQSPMYSLRARLIHISRLAGEKYGVPVLSEEAVGELLGDVEPAVLAKEAAIEQGLALGTASGTEGYGAFGDTSTDVSTGTSASPASMVPTVTGTRQSYWEEPAFSVKAKLAHEYRDKGSDYRRAYYMGMDWQEVTQGKTAPVDYSAYHTYNKRGVCLISAKAQRDSKGRPFPPKGAQWGSDRFDLWVAALCNPDTQTKALELEAEGLMATAQHTSGFNAIIEKMVAGMEETQRQQAANLNAAMKGMPLPYNAPPKNGVGESNLSVLPPNAQVAGLPVNPVSWKGKWATLPPAPLPGAVAGEKFTPPPTTVPQQVVDPATGQVSTVQVPSGAPTQQYPGGPLQPTYPLQPGQTYPGYTPPPPPPPEESLEPKKKKKKKSSMTLPLVLGVGALGVGALVVIRSRR